MKRFAVVRRIEVRGVTRFVKAGSCNAESAEAAIRKLSSYTGVPASQLTAREVPPLKPVGEGKLP